MSAEKAGRRRRLVEHILTDPFIDLAFVQPLISDENLLSVIKRQAEVYSAIGDAGEGTTAFRVYREEVKKFVADKFSQVYRGSIKALGEKVINKKAARAWRALVTLLSSQRLIEETGIKLKLFPRSCDQLKACSDTIEYMVEEKAKGEKRTGVKGPEVVKKMLKRFDASTLCNLMPLLWWVNMVMESEVFEALFKYHLIASERELVESFVKSVEGTLSRVRGHIADPDYTRYEVLRALLSRCVELRGQYINKLHNAVVFVKLLRRSVKNPDRWDWFLRDDVLTYAMSLYMRELQQLLMELQKESQKLPGPEERELELNLSTLLSPGRGLYGGATSALRTLILTSPILMQYALEARGEIAVTPADIVTAVMRISEAGGKEDDFVASVHDIAEEIIDFWKDEDLLRRLKLYAEDDISPEALCRKDSFVLSIAAIVSIKECGLHITTWEKPELRLPPRMLGFDSLYVELQQLLSIMQRVWGW